MLSNRKAQMNLKPLMIEDGYDEKVIRYRIISPNEVSSSKSLPKSPPHISLDNIDQITNKQLLKELENRYDTFLERYQQVLLLHEVIDDYLDIRDAITIRLSRIERLERLKRYQDMYNTKSQVQEDIVTCEYNHSFQTLLPDDLKLSEKQIQDGYKPCPSEPKEFKCGCLSMKYYSQCSCKRTSSICKNINCNEKTMPVLKLHYYCLNHCQMKRKEEYLEHELTKVKKELSDIKRQSNSLDFEDYTNSVSKNPKKRRISKFPWKNL